MKFQLNRNIISLMVALVLGAFTVVLLNMYLSKEKVRLTLEKEKQLGQEIPVIVAGQDISRGTKLTANMIKMGNIRETALQPRALNSSESAVGKVAIADILSGEQISATKLMSEGAFIRERAPTSAPASSSAGLAMKVPSGKRAFTIAIDEVSAAGGMLRPNDYVDIMGTFPFSQQLGGKTETQNVSVTIFQNILVLAVGKDVSSSPDKPGGGGGTVTFALTPQQVEVLNFALDLGKIKLILRPPLETQIQTLPPVDARTVWQQILAQGGMQLPDQEAASAAVTTEKKPTKTVDVYRGNVKEVLNIE